MDDLAPPRAGDPRTRPPRRAWPKVMKAMRRVHLYSGLALVPFVILYGVTAVLFNHATLGSANEERAVSAAELASFGWHGLGPAAELAERVVAKSGLREMQLDPSAPPRFRGRVSYSGTADGIESTLIVEDPEGAARWLRRPARERPAGSPRRTYEHVEIDAAAWSANHAAVDALFAAATPAALNAGSHTTLRNNLRLEFGLLDGEERLAATFDFTRKSLAVEPRTEPSLPLRSFLLRLHTAHGYPREWGAAFVWAVVVDVMGAAMVLWAVSGLFMWWQMKNLRRVGALVLAACVAGGVPLVLGMWDRLAS